MLYGVFLRVTIIIVGFGVFPAIRAASVLSFDVNATNPQTSFPFNIADHVFEDATHGLYVASAEAISTTTMKPYAVSFASGSNTLFIPLTPEKATVNNSKDQDNPLYGKQFDVISLIGRRPTVVKNEAPHNVYMINKVGPVSVISHDDVKDANNAITDGIIALEGTNITVGDRIFAAVKKNGGDFGESGGGVAVLTVTATDERVTLSLHDASTTDTTQSDVNRAAPLDGSISAVKINNTATLTSNAVDMQWDAGFKKLFVAVRGTTGSNATDGMRAVLVGSVNSANKLTFAAIAPDAAFANSTQIVGEVGSSKSVDIYKVRTLRTSTDLPYMIVVGGSSGVNNKVRTVFALPLTEAGVLADKTQTPTDQFTGEAPYVFMGRYFATAATTSAGIPASTDAAAQVGGSGSLPGAITDVFTFKDSVFVTVGLAGNGLKPGLFSSQAVFAADGKIAAWTNWQRAGGASVGMFGVYVHPSSGIVTYLQGASSSTVDTVKRTNWNSPQNDGLFGGTRENFKVGLIGLLEASFPQSSGGVQRIFDFAPSYTGISTSAGTRIALLAATGLSKIALVETANDTSSSQLGAVGGDFDTNKREYTAGEVNSSNPPVSGTRYLTIAGGTLDTIGPVSAVEIVSNATYSWLCVGGPNGLAVLRDAATGNGWSRSTGLRTGMTQLSGQSFTAVGSVSRIRKLISDRNALYVLTDTTLYRVTLDDDVANWSFTPIASASSLPHSSIYHSFSDVIVSNKLALLAASNGLYRVGNGKDVNSVTSHSDADWTAVSVSEGAESIVRFFAVTADGAVQSIATGNGGQLYVLSGYTGYDQGRINRFYVNDVSGGSVGANTVQSVADGFIKNSDTGLVEHSFLANFGAYRSYFATDGSLFLSTRSKTPVRAVLLQALQSWIRSGRKTAGKKVYEITPGFLSSTLSITQPLRNSGTGSWVIASDTGLRSNE